MLQTSLREDASTSNTGPAFTTTLAERNTRINSANFNPHSVSFEREKTALKSLSTEQPVLEDQKQSCADSTPTGVDLEATDKNPDFMQTEWEQGEDMNDLQSSTAMFCMPRKDSCDEFGVEKVQYLNVTDFQGNPEQSPRVRSSSIEEDNGTDPLDGLHIPRERVYSFGSASVYSAKEISDDLYKQFMADIKNCIRSYGFFEAFPSPSVVREAQNIYRKLEMPTPVDDDGNVLPHPTKTTKQTYISAESETLNGLEEKMHQVKQLHFLH